MLSNAERIVLEDARNRIRSGVAHIAVAAVYPIELRSTPTAKLFDALRTSRLRFRIVAELGGGEDWYDGTAATLMEAMRRLHESLAKDDIVEATAKPLNLRLQGVAQLWMGQSGVCDRPSEMLGIQIPKNEDSSTSTARRETAAKVSALVLANAFIFQEQLTRTNSGVPSLLMLDAEEDILIATAKHWTRIWKDINYVPIFQLGERIIRTLPSGSQSSTPVRALLCEARVICSQQAALRHDLMGRIYHWLLHHAKFLGTYYTAVSSATLLLKLTMDADWGEVDFGNPDHLTNFRVADLACGTGTLLMASAQAISDSYIRERAATDRPLDDIDLSTLHKVLMESILYGYDVLPSAVHLTASTLAMLPPEVAFVNMNLYVMPMGMEDRRARLGSLDFLTTDRIETQMTLDNTHRPSVRVGAARTHAATARVPKLDLCVMNPPFVRSVGGNLLFGSLPDDERKPMQVELKRRVKRIGASAVAGLGSIFLALADRHLGLGGRLAFVLPAAIVSGEAWASSRNLIASRYHLEFVISSHDAERQNFSENTDLSEVMFVARKLQFRERPGPTTYINPWRNPRSIYEAMDLANRIGEAGTPISVDSDGLTTIPASSGNFGEMISMPPASGEGNWTGALFAQTELLRVCWRLRDGSLRVPGRKRGVRIPVCRIDQLGSLGPDRKRISEGFKVSTRDWSPYPAFWGHKSEEVRTIKQAPNARLLVWQDSPRGPDYGPHLWERAGRLLLVERLRTNTHRVIATGFDQEVLANTWRALKPTAATHDREKALLLWLNSSLSMLLFYGARVVTEGAWMQMKQPAWQSMPVLDIRAITGDQSDSLAESYDSLAVQELLPWSQMADDPVRRKIDSAIAKTLGLPELDLIRELFAREPGLSAEEINHPGEDHEESELIA